MTRAFVAALAAAAASAATCPYASLSSTIAGILISDSTYCKPTEPYCVVNRACEWQSGYTYSALGNFTGFPRNASGHTRLIFTGSDLATDFTYFSLPDYIDHLTFTNYPTVTLTKSFAWPSRLTNLNFNQVNEIIMPLNIKWPSKLSDLTISNSNMSTVPPLPSNLKALWFFGNAISTSDALRTLPLNLTWLALGNNAFTELVNLDWRNLLYLFLENSPKLQRIANVTLSPKLALLNIANVALTDWTMDASTYSALNGLKPLVRGLMVDDPTREYFLGFDGRGFSAKSEATSCGKLGGATSKLWSQDTASVCVLQVKTTTPTTAAPTMAPAPVEPSSSIGTTVGVAIGAAIAIGCIVFFVMRRRQASTDYTRTETPHPPFPIGPPIPGLNMSGLTNLKLDETKLVLKNVVGAGGFAKVHKGTLQGRDVAVKVLLDSGDTKGGHIQSFIDEIVLMDTLKSPYIVELLGAAWTRPSDLKCVMELMAGGDLRTYLERHTATTFPWNEKLRHIHDIACGVEYLHSVNVIHRDLKSRNVLVDPAKPTKLTDFGISKEDFQTTMTMGVGTFRWMAPEVLMDEGHYSSAADIYSFGMLLSEFSTHQIPYMDLLNEETREPLKDTAIMVMLASGTIRLPTFAACPAWVHALATQCLSRNPTDRPTASILSNLIRKNTQAHS